jgi:hypothetical protein
MGRKKKQVSDPETEAEPPKKNYSSPEARARQLAGLSGVRIKDYVDVDMEKTNGKGMLATVPEETKKKVIEMFMGGATIVAITRETNLHHETVELIKRAQLDVDSQFRNAVHKASIREKLQHVAQGTADRLIDLMDEMSAKDAAIALGIVMDKLAAIEKDKSAEVLHQHIHLHSTKDISIAFDSALRGVMPPQDK